MVKLFSITTDFLAMLQIYVPTLSLVTATLMKTFFHVYKPNGHVHTGNLDIITIPELRNVMKKGARFREPKAILKKMSVGGNISDQK